MKLFTFRTTLCALAFAAALSSPVFAQQYGGQSGSGTTAQQGGHTMQGGQMMMGQPTGPAAKDYHAAMEKMHKDMMAKPMPSDADRHFAMMMLPHHQAAIDMAKAQLKHGKDAELKKMSEKMIKEQEKEVAELNEWLADHK